MPLAVQKGVGVVFGQRSHHMDAAMPENDSRPRPACHGVQLWLWQPTAPAPLKWRFDIGCGGGYFTFRFVPVVGPNGKVFAVDISAEALKSVRERVQRERLANVEVVQSAATDCKLPSASLDVAFCCEVLHEMPAADRLPLIRDVVRALRPGGLLLLIDWRKSHEITFDPYEKLIPRDDLVQLGTDAGLALDAEFHYLKYQVFLRFRKPPPK
jgi:arsenite methyltransferase